MDNGDNKESHEEAILPFLCPFCNGEFSYVPEDIEAFNCGWCSNRLIVKKEVPALFWKNFFSRHFSAISYVFMSNPDALVVRSIVPYGEAWRENRKNLYVVLEMSILCVLYFALSVYMKHIHVDLIIFTHPLFYAIPLLIATFYFLIYSVIHSRLNPPNIPVLRPRFREEQRKKKDAGS